MAKTYWKPALSILLALTLLMSTLPFSALANGQSSVELYWCYHYNDTNYSYTTDLNQASLTFNNNEWAFGTAQTLTDAGAAIVVSPTDGYRVAQLDVLCTGINNNTNPYSCSTYNENATYRVRQSDSNAKSIETSEFTVSSACTHVSRSGRYYLMVTLEQLPTDRVTGEEQTYTVTYKPGEGAGTDYTDDTSYAFADSYTVLDAADSRINFTREGYLFSGWQVTSCSDTSDLYSILNNTYAAGDVFYMPAGSIELTALWDVAPIPTVPELSISKEAHVTSAKVGDTVTYTITVTNSGTGDATNVVITDTPSNNLSIQGDTSWTTNTLSAGASIEKTVTATVIDLGNGKAINTAAVCADGVSEIRAAAEIEISQPPPEPEPLYPELSISKETNVTSAKVGDTVTYTISVTNSGTGDASNVVITDIPSDNLSIQGDTSWTIDTLSASAGISKTVTATITGLGNGKAVNTATVCANNVSEIRAAAEIDITQPDPDPEPLYPLLSISKEANVTSANIDDTITYTITVTNSGTGDATNVVIADAPSPNLTIHGDATWFVDTLAAGAVIEKTVTAEVTGADNGKAVNSATVRADGIYELSADTAIDVITHPELSIEITNNTSHAYVGDTILYTVTVTNIGDVVLENIAATDDLLGKPETIVLLAVGDQQTYTYTYKIPYSRAGTTLINTATATAAGVPGVSDTATTAIYEIYYDAIEPEIDSPSVELNCEDHYAYIIGKEDGLVHPEDSITRAETVTILFRMLSEDSREYYWSQENSYLDVTAENWFNNAVSTLTNAGIVHGRPDNLFAADANISRGEFASLVVRFFAGHTIQAPNSSLIDISGHWAEADIHLACVLGLITGYPDDTFRPDQEISRAEVMVIMNRALQRAPHKDHLLEDMILWPDNMDPDNWYYADVQEATNSHTFSIAADAVGNFYEVWQALLPVRDWASLETEWSQLNSSASPGEVM